MKMHVRGAGTGIVLAVLLSSTSLAQTIEDGVFSSEQAERGESAYFNSCAACHGYDLIKTDGEASDLTGGEFSSNWVGQTLAARHDYIATSMPADDPGSLEDQTVLDIIAFILDFNAYSSGEDELTIESRLEDITIPEAP